MLVLCNGQGISAGLRDAFSPMSHEAFESTLCLLVMMKDCEAYAYSPARADFVHVKQSKHEAYIDLLITLIHDEYDYIMKNVKCYGAKNRVACEADIIAVTDGVADIYEVKCSFRPTKARKQLRRLRRYISRELPVRHTYFFPGSCERIMRLCEDDRRR